jgi:hypothetical protein
MTRHFRTIPAGSRRDSGVFRSVTGSVLLLAVLIGCGGDEQSTDVPQPAAEALRQAGAALGPRSGGSVTPLAPAQLARRFPAQVNGMPRVEKEQQDMSPAGLGITMASATYKGHGRKRVTVSITDTGGLPMAGAAGVAWAMADYDRTTGTGYERTTRISGFKAMESQSRQGGVLRAEVAVLAGDRFLVQLKGNDVDVSLLRATLNELDIRALANQR